MHSGKSNTKKQTETTIEEVQNIKMSLQDPLTK